MKRKCHLQGCRVKSLSLIECHSCYYKFCATHRLVFDHECIGLPSGYFQKKGRRNIIVLKLSDSGIPHAIRVLCRNHIQFKNLKSLLKFENENSSIFFHKDRPSSEKKLKILRENEAERNFISVKKAADSKYEQKRYDEAIELYRECIRLDSTTPIYHCKIAESYVAMGYVKNSIMWTNFMKNHPKFVGDFRNHHVFRAITEIPAEKFHIEKALVNGVSYRGLVRLNGNGESFLSMACYQNKMIDYIFSKYQILHQDLFRLDSYNQSPFYWLCANFWHGIDSLFTKYEISSAELFQLDSDNRSPFYWLCRNNYPKLTELFVKYEIKHRELFEFDIYNLSPFRWLCNNNYPKISDLFENYEISHNELFQHTLGRKSPFLLLCYHNYPKMSNLFENYEISHNELFEFDHSRTSPFYWLCFNNYSKMSELLEKYEITRDELLQPSYDNKSPFYWLSFNKYSKMNELCEKYQIHTKQLDSNNTFDLFENFEVQKMEFFQRNSKENHPASPEKNLLAVKKVADSMYQQKRYDEAIGLYRECIQLDNTTTIYHCKIAESYVAMGYVKNSIMWMNFMKNHPKFVGDFRNHHVFRAITEIPAEKYHIEKALVNGVSYRGLVRLNGNGESFLSMACYQNKMIDYIFSKYQILHQDLFRLDSYNQSPFYWLCAAFWHGIDSLFTKYEISSAELFQLDSDNRSPFYWLCHNNYPKLTELFVKYEIKHDELFQLDIYNLSPFSWLCNNIYPKISDLFENYDIKHSELFQLNFENQSPFLLLCQHNYPKMSNLFENYEISHNELFELDLARASPFYWLCFNNYSKMSELLEKYEITRDELLQPSYDNKSPFYWLSFNKYSKTNDLCEKYNDKEQFQPDSKNRSPFHSNDSISSELLENYEIKKRGLFQLDSQEGTLFYRLCFQNYSKMSELFENYEISKKELFKLDSKKRSPFYLLCHHNYPKIGELFNKYKINKKELFQLDSKNRSPFYLLCHHNYSKISELFETYNITHDELFQLDSTNRSPFYLLCHHNYPKISELFTTYKITPDELFQLDSDNRSLFYLLCYHNYPKISELIGKYNIQDENLLRTAKDNSFPYYYMCKHGNSSLVPTLSPLLFSTPSHELFSAFDYLIQYSSPVLKQIPTKDFSELLKEGRFGNSRLFNVCKHAPFALLHFLSSDHIKKNHFLESFASSNPMMCLAENNYQFPVEKWNRFPNDIENIQTINLLVQAQNPFLEHLLDSEITVSTLDPGLVQYLKCQFKKLSPEESIDEKYLFSTEYDPLKRSCGLYWLEKNYSMRYSELKLDESDKTKYLCQTKPLIEMEQSPNIVGTGSISTIFKCTYTGQDACVKVIRNVKFGAHEIRINENLQDKPFICKMLNAAVYGDETKLVLEKYDGDLRGLLHDKKKKKKKIGFTLAVHIIWSVLQALKSCHDLNIVHRDIKPENILLRLVKDHVEVALSDFGLAKLLPTAEYIHSGTLVGTMAYLSPESRKNRFGLKSDIYSLGIVFYEILTGEIPHEGKFPHLGTLYEVVGDVLKKMLSRLESRPSVSELLKVDVWKTRDDRCYELKLPIYKKKWAVNRTQYPGPNIEGLTILEKEESKLGRGAFGEVYQGYLNGEKVAVKKIRKEKNNAVSKNGVLDAKELPSHEHICKILAHGEDEKHFYVVLEYCDQSYESWFEEHQELGERLRAIHLKQMLEGLSHLHKNNIIHRDLKPANVLMKNGVIKIADFGLSKLVKSEKGKHKDIGTKGYAAPEVQQGYYGKKVDIWSIGVLYLDTLGAQLKPSGDVRPSRSSLKSEFAPVNQISSTPSISNRDFESVNQMSSTTSGDSVPEVKSQEKTLSTSHLNYSDLDAEILCVQSDLTSTEKQFFSKIFVPYDERSTADELLKSFKYSINGLEKIEIDRLEERKKG